MHTATQMSYSVHNLQELLRVVRQLIEVHAPSVVVLEGEIGSGKSHLANLLTPRLVTMDDFYLPAERQPEDVLQKPGSHMDLERFEQEVLKRLKEETFRYRAFDCRRQIYEERVLPVGELTVIEGNYALMKSLGRYYDMAIFLEVDRHIQRERVLLRDGAQAWERYRKRWIPASEKYFEQEQVRARCDALVCVV